MIQVVTLILTFFGAVSSFSDPTTWPRPNATARPIFHLGGLDNQPGYVGDANGMMFRRVPWNNAVDEGGLFHVAWQCVTHPNGGLNWCHSTSSDFVHWTPLPPMYNRTGGGAESGGVAQLPNGDVIAIFNQIGGGGHWQARPVNITDPHLRDWRITQPNGTTCEDKTQCVVTPGIPGTDLSQAFLDGSDDGYWRVIADRGHATGVTGAAMLTKTKDFTKFEVESLFHEYKWTRCTSLPKECGFGPYPRDPNAFEIPSSNGTWVLYSMQKTCSFSGREFYSLGKYDDVSHRFVPLDVRSDLANNVWDGGEGYAAMHIYDPLQKRVIWIQAIIEGDRDPCSGVHGEGFWQTWMIERDIGRGWFGTLGLPRVVSLEDLTSHHVPGTTDVHLLTPAIPELSLLRISKTAYHQHGVFSVGSNSLWPDQNDVILPPRGNSMEYNVSFGTKDIFANSNFDHSNFENIDVGLRVLWDDTNEEYTRVGVRDGTYLEGVDLWDEINGDSHVFNVSSSLNKTLQVKACRDACLEATVQKCTAWTLSFGGLCRFKAEAQHALQIASNNGAFLPYHNKSISGYIHLPTLRFMSLYIDRTHSTKMVPITNTNYSYPKFNYSKLLMVVSNEDAINLHVFVDRSIVEVFAQGGRSVVTARVYPSKPSSTRVGVFNEGTVESDVQVLNFDAWELSGAKAENFELLQN
eukprot:g2775.t1